VKLEIANRAQEIVRQEADSLESEEAFYAS
jgi:hypothetical protein